MPGEIELIRDGDGLGVLGDPVEVDGFLAHEGLSSSIDLGLTRLGTAMSVGSAAAQAGSDIAAASGRWVKLTKESAQAIDKYGLRQSSKTGCSTGVLKGKSGQIKGFVEFARTPGAMLTNPAMLAGVAGIMSQMAMQQSMQEITNYLATIDEKVDDVLRAQKDAVLARMIGVGLTLDEAMTIREHRGRVDEVTWSKVQGAPATIAETQAYALRQLDAIAEKLERHSKVGDLANVAKEAEATTQEWLAVLARSVQLQDAIAVLELDRVLDSSPEDLDRHRLGVRAARNDRISRISRVTNELLDRMAVAADRANSQVLLHPAAAPGVVHATNHVGSLSWSSTVGSGSRRTPTRSRLAVGRTPPCWLEPKCWRPVPAELRSRGALDRSLSNEPRTRRATCPVPWQTGLDVGEARARSRVTNERGSGWSVTTRSRI